MGSIANLSEKSKVAKQRAINHYRLIEPWSCSRIKRAAFTSESLVINLPLIANCLTIDY